MPTNKEQLDNIEEKINQLNARKKAILSREKEQTRKERTRRLIQVGAVVEKYCGEISDIDAFEKYVNDFSLAIKKTQKGK